MSTRKYDDYIYKTAMGMRFDGISSKDISATLGVSANTVNRWIQEAKAEAAATLQRCSYDLTEIARNLRKRPATPDELNAIADRLDTVLHAFNL